MTPRTILCTASELRKLHDYEAAQRRNFLPMPLGPLTLLQHEQIAKALQLARTVALNRQSNQQLRSKHGQRAISLLPAR